VSCLPAKADAKISTSFLSEQTFLKINFKNFQEAFSGYFGIP
jgi:hypothetical protein